MTDELSDSIAKYGKASVEGGLAKPTSSLPKPPKPKRGGHKKDDTIHEGIAGLLGLTETTPEERAATLDKHTALMAERQSFVGLIPTIPPKEPPKPKVGRSTKLIDYTPDQLNTLLSLTAEGYSLNRISMRDDMPYPVTIRMWCVENPSFYSQYARARDLGLIARADNMRDEMATNPDPVRAKLLFDHDKWFLAKMMPKTYGERSELHTTQTIEHKHVIDVGQLTPDALAALEGALIEAKALPSPTQDVVTRPDGTEDSGS